VREALDDLLFPGRGPVFRRRARKWSLWDTLEAHRQEIAELAARQALERETEEEHLRDLDSDHAKDLRNVIHRRQYGELLYLLETQGAYLRTCDNSTLRSLVLREREEILRLLSPGRRSVIELLD
jgi:hypothetical protein